VILCRIERAQEVKTAPLLQEFDIMRELLNLIATLRMRIRSGLGCDAFAGLSMVTELLLSRLPTSAEQMQSVASILDVTRGVQKLSLLVKAASMTAADAVGFRSTSLAELLTKVGVQESWSMSSVSAAPETVFPEWKLAAQVSATPVWVITSVHDGMKDAELKPSCGAQVHCAISPYCDPAGQASSNQMQNLICQGAICRTLAGAPTVFMLHCNAVLAGGEQPAGYGRCGACHACHGGSPNAVPHRCSNRQADGSHLPSSHAPARA
jgi:hypothetical protein